LELLDTPHHARLLARAVAGTVAVALVTGIAPYAAPAAAAQLGDGRSSFRLTTLPPVAGGTVSHALGLNEAGDVIGTARTTTGSRPQVTTLWRAPDYAPTSLGTLAGSTFSRSFDLNSAGVAVGEAFTPAPEEASRAVRWAADGSLTELAGLMPGGGGVANDISDAGHVVGSARTASGVGRAWSAVGATLRELPVPASAHGEVTTTRAIAVNNSGVAVGTATVLHPHDDHTHAIVTPALWRHSGAELLDAPGGEEAAATAYGVTESTLVVGEASVSGAWKAVAWHSGDATVLPSLTGLSMARAISANDRGQIVGHATGFYGFPTFDGRAVLWEHGNAIDLNTAAELPTGWVLREASDINSRGQIVGYATTPEGTRGFLLTPVVNEAYFSHLHGLLDSFGADGTVSARTVATIRERLERAQAAAAAGSELRAIAALEQLAARVDNQVKGDTRDLLVRNLLRRDAADLLSYFQMLEAAENAS
jgi:uncharacterized membrane protein